jgi:hypothetical protein
MTRSRDVSDRWQALALLGAALAVGSWWRSGVERIEADLTLEEQRLEQTANWREQAPHAHAVRDVLDRLGQLDRPAAASATGGGR